ncbi:MAG: phosphotransferase family protein [Aquihabitans sp.]
MAENFDDTPDVVEPDGAGGPAALASDHITTSSRDPGVLGSRLRDWLATRLPAGSNPVVDEVVKPDGNGMSSETILFNAKWQDDGGPTEGRFVARIEPELDKVPLFPRYDLALQFRVMAIVAEATVVPVPVAPWFEADREVIGTPFFVMERIDGDVPPDLLPYTFPDDNFVAAATPEQRARMQRSAVTALAGIHQVTPNTHDLDFLAYHQPGDSVLERHLAQWEGYLEWASEADRSPLLDECFSWLRSNLPADQRRPPTWWCGPRWWAPNTVATWRPATVLCRAQTAPIP